MTWVHTYARLLAAATLLLITAGGMFTRSMNQVASPRLAAMFHSGDQAGFWSQAAWLVR